MKNFDYLKDCGVLRLYNLCAAAEDNYVCLRSSGNAGKQHARFVSARVHKINDELANPTDSLPPITVSVGAAYGGSAADANQLFERADKALYRTKRNGKCGLTFAEDDP